MSGHSHFRKIKHQKALTDAKRSQGFSKISREITVAAREGADPEFNSKLRLAIEKAKSMNMPTDNIERALKRGTEGLGEEKLDEILFEAYGPGGIAIIIEGITDNKNRSLNEIRQILQENGGKLVGEGAVKWMFERKACIIIEIKNQISLSRKQKFSGNLKIKKDELELLVIEAGAEDVYWHDDLLDVYTKIEDLEKVKKNLEERGIKIESTSLDWVAKEMIGLGEKDRVACQKLFETLDENDAVQEIYSNLKP
jgi:YebC/PmpR family DNA-binding regulatory protein